MNSHQTRHATAELCFSQIDANSCGFSGAQEIAKINETNAIAKRAFQYFCKTSINLELLSRGKVALEPSNRTKDELTMTIIL